MVSIVEDEPIVSRDVYSVSYSHKPVPPERGPFYEGDLGSMPDNGLRYEIVDGTLIVSAAPGRLHQRAVLRLAILLDAACPPELEVMLAPFWVAVALDTVMEPDVLVGSRTRLTDKLLRGEPELAVEVLSPSSRQIDLHVKRERFERAECPSCWVVDPCARPGRPASSPGG